MSSKNLLALGFGALLVASTAAADERLFGYSYEADVLHEGELEFEQWATDRIGKQNGNYSRWDFREEFEYGITDRLTTAVYLNMKDVYWSPADENEEGEDKGLDFEGFSSEWKYQVLNPFTDPVGLVLYGEVTTDGGEELELEEKVILSKSFGDLTAAFNAKYEQEWEFEHGDTEREAALEFTSGVSYKLCGPWSAGLELRNVRTYPGGHDLDGQEYSAWFVGPNVHYGAPKWWATFTVLPQVHGNGPGQEDHLQLDEHERVEARLIFGVSLS